VEKQTEAKLEAEIYEAYSKCYEGSSDRRQVNAVKLWRYASRWCMILFPRDSNLLYKDEDLDFIINGIGDEIYIAIDSCIKKDRMPKEEFLIYFKKALFIAKNKSYNEISYEKDQDGKERFLYRKYGGGGFSEPRIMKDIRKKIKRIKEEGIELTHDDLVNRLSGLLSLSEKTIRKHLLFMYRNRENDITKADENASITVIKTPEMEDDAAEMIKDELENFLDEKREITRDIYRALFTGICINEGIHYFRKIWPILDSEILEDYWKDPTIVPNDYEIYMKKRPLLKQNSAGSGASDKLGKLTEELRKAIIENHPELYSVHERSKYHE
jgi:hypothetical protein